jgi:hypothetical protein
MMTCPLAGVIADVRSGGSTTSIAEEEAIEREKTRGI